MGETIKLCFVDTLRTTCMVFLIHIGAGLYAFFLTLAQVPQLIENGRIPGLWGRVVGTLLKIFTLQNG